MSASEVDIFAEIEAGYWDGGLQAIAEAVNARRIYLRDQQKVRNMMNFVPGTKVRIINIRPKYLMGITGVISPNTAARQGDLLVDVDPSCYGRLGRYGRKLGVPASSLEEVQ
jgi:hypothetical protein